MMQPTSDSFFELQCITCNDLFINFLPLQQLEMGTLRSPNDVAPRKMNTMLGDNKNTQTRSMKVKVGGIR